MDDDSVPTHYHVRRERWFGSGSSAASVPAAARLAKQVQGLVTPYYHSRMSALPFESVLLLLMREIDKHEDLDNHPIRQSDAYEKAVKELGWDIDWDELYERKSQCL